MSERTPRRPAARASALLPPPPHGTPAFRTPMGDLEERALLQAKAEVCDAYRVWLVTTSKRNRLIVSAALERLRQLEDEFVQGALQ